MSVFADGFDRDGVYRATVPGCADCPLRFSIGGVDGLRTQHCGHSGASEHLPYSVDGVIAHGRNASPHWCPLRTGPLLLSLAQRDNGPDAQLGFDLEGDK